MRTVITISLNGNAYQIDAVGFDALRAYLQVAEERLAGNPDRDEILADLEQAIADKCLRYLGPHKNVVTAAEVTEVLREMGPVDGGFVEGSDNPSPEPEIVSKTEETSTIRRLYQIRAGAMISGVCKGLAAYLNLDVSIVRILFIVLTLLTGGAWILVYIVMMFVIRTPRPRSNTRPPTVCRSPPRR